MNPDSDTPQISKSPATPRRVLSTFSDWVYLLDGPRNKIFLEIVKREDWRRLFNLLILTLILSGALVGTRLTLEAIYTSGANLVLQSPVALMTLIIGAMLGVFYSGVAYLSGIKISLPKSFFLILSLGLPWIPIVAFIDIIPTLPYFKLIGVIFLLSHLILIKPVFNLYRGVLVVTKCAKWRALVSVLAPIIIFTFLLLYMFGD